MAELWDSRQPARTEAAEHGGDEFTALRVVTEQQLVRTHQAEKA
jgi:hypothetical protein